MKTEDYERILDKVKEESDYHMDITADSTVVEAMRRAVTQATQSPDTLTLTKTELLDLMYKARSVPHTLEQILFDYLEDIEGQKI